MAANSTGQSYKQLKEDFVSNLSGGSVAEIASVCAVAPVCQIDETKKFMIYTSRIRMMWVFILSLTDRIPC